MALDPIPTIQAIVALFPAVPDSSVQEYLIVFDSLLNVSDAAYRPVLAGMLRTAVESSRTETRRAMLSGAADAIKAGEPSTRTPDGLTAKEAAAKGTANTSTVGPSS